MSDKIEIRHQHMMISDVMISHMMKSVVNDVNDKSPMVAGINWRYQQQIKNVPASIARKFHMVDCRTQKELGRNYDNEITIYMVKFIRKSCTASWIYQRISFHKWNTVAHFWKIKEENIQCWPIKSRDRGKKYSSMIQRTVFFSTNF